MKLTIAIGGTITGLQSALSKGYGSIKAFAGKISNAFQGLGGALTAAISIHGVKRGLAALDEIGKRANSLGVTTDALQQLSQMASLAGSSGEALETAFKKMLKTITDAQDGLAGAKDSLAGLDLSYRDLAGLSPEEQFKKIVQALNQVDDATRRSALSQELFGRAGVELQTFIRDFSSLREEVDKLGAIIPESEIRAAERLNDEITKLGINWAAAAMKGVQLAKDIAAGDPTGEVRLRRDRMSQVWGMAKEAAGLGEAGIAQRLFQVADTIGSSTSIKELEHAVKKYRELKEVLDGVRKANALDIAEAKEVAAQEAATAAAAEKAAKLEEDQNTRLGEHMRGLEEKLRLQKMIIEGKEKEAAIEKELSDAAKRAGRDLTDAEKSSISSTASALYDASQKPEDMKMVKALSSGDSVMSDVVRRIGGNIGGGGGVEATAKNTLAELKKVGELVKNISDKTAFNGTGGGASWPVPY